MKFLISGLLIASLAIVFFYVGEAAQAQSLVLYLPFDEGSGDKTSDLSNNGNDGTLGNNPTWTEGKFKNALEFDGADDYVETTTNSFFPMSAGTIEAWIWANNTDAKRYIFCIPVTDTNRIYLYVSNSVIGYGLGTESRTTIALEARAWHHLAMVWEKANWIIYVDGIEEGTGGYPEFVPAGQKAFIGSFKGISEYWDGIIDELRVYNRALDQTEIEEDMKGPTAVNSVDKLATNWGKIKSLLMIR